MIYKTLKKVSNVCQVLDKSKYHATTTNKGVTFTNNADGTYTVNGTATETLYYIIIFLTDTLYPSHQYLLTGENSGLYLFVENRDKDNKILSQLRHNIIRSLPTNTKKSTFECYIEQGTVCDNLIFKPQLFDLTEMYGAGNEPTTVEQFRQDFPDEMYDYKPYCFVKSYKSVMICKTKNLFPTSTAVGTISGWSQATARQFEEDKWYIGISANNYYIPSNIIEYELTGNYVYINLKGGGYGIGKVFKCEPNQTYTMTCKWVENTNYMQISIGFYDENGNYLSYNAAANLAERHAFTTPANCKWFTVCFVGNSGGSSYIYNMQLEEGSTPTDFVPYGYLQSYKKSLVCTTKNLFNPLGREDANPIGNWPITKYDVGNVIYRGFAYSGYYQLDESYKCDVTVSGTVINVVQKIANYGIGYIVKCNPNTVYTLSFETNFNVVTSIFLDLEGNRLGYSWSRTFTTPNNAYYLLVALASSTIGTYSIKNLQLELGDTATEYHPYGYL